MSEEFDDKYIGKLPAKKEVAPVIQMSPSQCDFELLKDKTRIFWKSGLLPKHIQTPEQALYIAAKGEEVGLKPIQAWSQIFIVQGKLGFAAELMLALVYKMYPTAQVNFLTPIDKQTSECEAEFIRPGGKPSLFKFSLEDAKRAGVSGGSGWTKYPQSLLRARVISAGCRAIFPECLLGASHTPEELGAEPQEEKREQRPQTRELSSAPNSSITDKLNSRANA